MRVVFILLGVIVFTFQACRTDSIEELSPKSGGGCDTTKARYSQAVSKILETRCALPGCHKGVAVRQSIGDFDTHEGIKIYLDNKKQRFLDAINHNAGTSPMPKNGAKLPDCDILQLTTWINNGYPNN